MARLSDAYCKNRLAGWQKEYGVPGVIEWSGYTELGGSISKGYRNGECRYYTVTTADGTYPLSRIYLDEEHGQAPAFFQTCTLWHEFCHANAFNEDTEDNDHDRHFREYRRRKVSYWLGDMLYKLIGIFWSTKNV